MINRPKITPEQLNMFTEPVTDIYRALEEDVFLLIAKRLRTSDDITADDVLNWQMDKLKQLRLLNEDTVKALSRTTGIAEREIRQIIKDAGLATIDSVDHELKDVYAKLPKPSDIDNVLESYVSQTFREFDNFINQTLITSTFGTGTTSRTYQRIIEETTAKMMTGTKSINQAVTETIVKWQDKGLASGFVDKGGNVWSVENYARTTITSTVNRTYNDLRTSRMDEYDVHTVLVSSLPDPRDICSKIQGKVVSMRQPHEDTQGYPSIYDYGYGTPGGIRGINCRHLLIPYIPGVNSNNQREYSDKDMEKQREERQKQRYFERQIRKAKQHLKVAEAIGDEDSILKYRQMVRRRQQNIRRFIDETGRTRQYSREKVY